MREAGVAEGRGEGRGDGDEDHGAEDGARGEDASVRARGGARAQEVDVACQGGEGGLDGVEENGVGEALGGRRGAVWGCSYALLEEGP